MLIDWMHWVWMYQHNTCGNINDENQGEEQEKRLLTCERDS